MNKKRVVLVMLLLVMGVFRFCANAAYMGYTGVVQNEIGLRAVRPEVTYLYSTESNAQKTASFSNAECSS